MQLKELTIIRNPHSFEWQGVKPGETGGKIVLDTPTSEIKFTLTSEHCAKIFALVADALVDTAKEAATHLIIEARAQQATLIGCKS